MSEDEDMDYAKRRADRIRNTIDLGKILEDYGYSVRSNMDREQQFSCDLHGDGRDGKPSARYYPGSQSWYCFACGRARDAITTVKEKEGWDFNKACSHLERQNGLSPLPYQKKAKTKKRFSVIEEKAKSWAEVRFFVEDMMLTHTKTTLSLKESLKLWQAFDLICYQQQQEVMTEEDAIKNAQRIVFKIMELSKGRSS